MDHGKDEAAARLEEKRHLMTLEGLADIAAGNFVEHQEIEDWLASLADDDEQQP